MQYLLLLSYLFFLTLASLKGYEGCETLETNLETNLVAAVIRTDSRTGGSAALRYISVFQYYNTFKRLDTPYLQIFGYYNS